MEDEIIVKYHDIADRHLSICCGSVRMDVHRRWDLEKYRFEEAYKLHNELKKCVHPLQAAGLLQAADDEVMAYLPVIGEAQTENYSSFLLKLAERVKEDGWPLLNCRSPVTKIFSENGPLRGNTIESRLVDLIPLDENYFYALQHRLSTAFPYLMQDKRDRLIKIAYDKANPKPQQPAPYHFEDSRQMLRRQSQEFLDWFRAGNRKD